MNNILGNKIHDQKLILEEINTIDINYITESKIIDIICRFGLFYDKTPIYGVYTKCMNKPSDLMGLWQKPKELAMCILYLINNCEINSFLEIGTFKASTFLILKHFLTKKNTDLISKTIDVYQHIDKSIFEFFDINFELTSIEHITSQYDLIFIDADHSYKEVSKDFEYSLRLKPKYILFHDINDKYCPDVVKFWNEIKNNFIYKEFSSHDKNIMGLGLITL